VKVDRTEPAYRTPSIEAPPAQGPPETGPPLSPKADIPDKKITRFVVIDRCYSGAEEKPVKNNPPIFPVCGPLKSPDSLGRVAYGMG